MGLFLQGPVGPRCGASSFGAWVVGVSTLPHRRLTADLGWVVKSSGPPDSQAARVSCLPHDGRRQVLQQLIWPFQYHGPDVWATAQQVARSAGLCPKSAQVSGAPRECGGPRASALSGAVLQ